MTLDEFIEKTKYTPEEQARFIGTYGEYSGDVDYAVTPAGVELNGVLEVVGKGKREFYTWAQINEHIDDKAQIRFF